MVNDFPNFICNDSITPAASCFAIVSGSDSCICPLGRCVQRYDFSTGSGGRAQVRVQGMSPLLDHEVAVGTERFEDILRVFENERVVAESRMLIRHRTITVKKDSKNNGQNESHKCCIV